MQDDIIRQQLVCWGPERNVTAKPVNSYSCLLTNYSVTSLQFCTLLLRASQWFKVQFRLLHAGTLKCHDLHICFKRDNSQRPSCRRQWRKKPSRRIFRRPSRPHIPCVSWKKTFSYFCCRILLSGVLIKFCVWKIKATKKQPRKISVCLLGHKTFFAFFKWQLTTNKS